MKLGMNLLLWTDHVVAEHHSELFERIKGYGFDGVEIPLDGLTPDEVREIAVVLNTLGLGRTAISALDANVADPASKDARLRLNGIEYLKHIVDNTALLGANLLCGPLFQGLGRFTGRAPDVEEWNYAIETIRAVGEYAERHGIRIALEPINRFEMYMVNTLAEGVRFVKEVGLTNVGLLADTHHGNIEEQDVAAAWEAAWPYIFHIHVSENHRGVPGTGHAITDGVINLLNTKSYEEWVTIEAFNGNVPGLASRLHLWRRLAVHDDDAARLGIAFLKNKLHR